MARRQILRVDVVTLAVADRALRRSTSIRPNLPLQEPIGGTPPRAAGPLARAVAFLIDSFAASSLFGLAISLAGFLFGLFTNRTLDGGGSSRRQQR